MRFVCVMCLAVCSFPAYAQADELPPYAPAHPQQPTPFGNTSPETGDHWSRQRRGSLMYDGCFQFTRPVPEWVKRLDFSYLIVLVTETGPTNLLFCDGKYRDDLTVLHAFCEYDWSVKGGLIACHRPFHQTLKKALEIRQTDHTGPEKGRRIAQLVKPWMSTAQIQALFGETKNILVNLSCPTIVSYGEYQVTIDYLRGEAKGSPTCEVQPFRTSWSLSLDTNTLPKARDISLIRIGMEVLKAMTLDIRQRAIIEARLRVMRDRATEMEEAYHEGELIGSVRTSQELLGLPISPREELKALAPEALATLAYRLKQQAKSKP